MVGAPAAVDAVLDAVQDVLAVQVDVKQHALVVLDAADALALAENIGVSAPQYFLPQKQFSKTLN